MPSLLAAVIGGIAFSFILCALLVNRHSRRNKTAYELWLAGRKMSPLEIAAFRADPEWEAKGDAEVKTFLDKEAMKAHFGLRSDSAIDAFNPEPTPLHRMRWWLIKKRRRFGTKSIPQQSG